jgi:hypothetical protein
MPDRVWPPRKGQIISPPLNPLHFMISFVQPNQLDSPLSSISPFPGERMIGPYFGCTPAVNRTRI